MAFHTAPCGSFFTSGSQMQTNHRRHLMSRSLQDPDVSQPPQFAGGAGRTEDSGLSGTKWPPRDKARPRAYTPYLRPEKKKKECKSECTFISYHCGTSRIQSHKYDSWHPPQEAYKMLRCRLLYCETVWGMQGHGAVPESGLGRSRGFVYEM